MHIAICDDDRNDLDILIQLVREYLASGTGQISAFSNAKELYHFTETTKVDIAILDIEMEAPNGYEIALQLINRQKPPIIIFVTNSMAYTTRGYGVAHRYLAKPLDKSLLWEALDTAVLKIKANRFTFAVDGCSQIIRMDDIYYFEIFSHMAVIHTADSEYSFRGSLKEIASQLPPGSFGSPHQSYLVHFSHIKSARTNEIILTNGIHIPVSRRKLKPFQEEFYRFLGRL